MTFLKQSLLLLTALAKFVMSSHSGSQIVNYFTNPIFVGRADPVVTPYKVSSHVHLVFGGGGFDLGMSENQALDAKCSANNIKTDLSNYWMPSVFFHAMNGSFFQVEAREYKVYYTFEETDDDLVPFPTGLHMVAGDAMSRTPPGPEGHNTDPSRGPIIPYEIQCVGTDVKFTDKFCTNYGGLRTNIYFPSCYNPKAGLTSYTNNMNYSNTLGAKRGSNCPKGWLHVPKLNLEVYWDVHKFDDEWTPGTGHIPWVFSHGDPTGAGAHADFVAGWQQAALTDAIAHCDSPQSFFNGALSDCYPKDKVTAAEGAACTVASPVDEQIWGDLAALPGCNPIQEGPQRAVPHSNCSATITIGEPATQHTDFTKDKGWEYYGCYTDAFSGRVLNHGAGDVPTIEKCIDLCTSNGYSMAGLEFSKECYCGNSVTIANGNGNPSSQCSSLCTGSKTEICGGPSLLSVYRKCGTTCQNGSGPVANGMSSPRSSPNGILTKLRRSTRHPSHRRPHREYA